MRLCVFLVLAIIAPLPAFAADWYTGAKPQQPTDDWIVSVDATTDVTTQGSYFADVEATVSPAGTLNESGLRLRLEGLAGRYSYFSSADQQTIRGTAETGTGLVGYAWVSPGISFAAYVGADIRNNTLSLFDPANPTAGTTVGAKGQFEFYATPSARTIVAADGWFATNETAYFARLRGGYLIGPNLFLGPEFVALGDAFFNQERLGLQLMGLRAGPLRFAFSAGLLYDRVRKGGGYTTFGAGVSF
jgi:Cellulose biosynthesis protein BcsS